MINQEELELRNALAHHGILGQKWGIRRFQNSDGSLTKAGQKRINTTIDDAASSFNRSAKRLKDKAAATDAYSYLRTDAKGTVNGSFSKKMNVSNAQSRSKSLKEKAKQTENVAKGITSAKKVIAGMNMKQAISTLQKDAGYKKVDVIMSKFMSKNDQLSFAAIDYALAKTSSGRKS